jgi:1,4-alpha-glucan branching enzyme
MAPVHEGGLYQVFVPERKPFPYALKVTEDDGQVREVEDPYRFPLRITEYDLYLFGEGSHYRTYERMGAHTITLDGVQGVGFAVWAPNAVRVSVIGEFNRWDGRRHPMQRRGKSGLWELFLPHLKPGDLYKFEIIGPHDFLAQKADPYAFAAELRPQTASVIWDNHAYSWNDENWMHKRRETDWLKKPISVYEVHLGSWRRVLEEDNRWLTYRELADQLIPYVKDLGFTHIEFLPISEHPFDGSWGYQTLGYFAPTSRFGTPDDLKYFIDQCHQQEIGVLLDWVPAHFPKDGHGLVYFDGTHLYEHENPLKGEHVDWGTLIFNYDRNEVRSFLLSNAMYWADIYHLDGMRVDAVASMLYLDYSRKAGEWIPNEYGGRENLGAVDFLKTFNQIIHEEHPGILTFAEESTAWPMVSRPTYVGGLGFGLKWNMGWMNDILEYISKDSVHRKYFHHHLTFSLVYAFSENFILPFSHDEVVHGKRSMLNKMPGDVWQKLANLRLLYAFMYAHPGKKLLFMGCEFGQWDEWDCQKSLDWHLLQWKSHRQIADLIRTLNYLHRDCAALHALDFSWEGFEWVDFHDTDNCVVSFIRRGEDPDDRVIAIFNFTPVPRQGYRLGVPGPGQYEEFFNSDASEFGGSNVRNPEPLTAEEAPWGNMKHSFAITLPPWGALYFRSVAQTPSRPERGPWPNPNL